MKTVLIRFDEQSAFMKRLHEQDPKEYVEKLGMKVLKHIYSSFGACYFMEVENYTKDPKNICVKLETDPKKFEWDSY